MKTIWWVLAIIIIILIGGAWYWSAYMSSPSSTPPTSTTGYTPDNILVTPAGLGLNYATSTYALAVTADQVSVKSYIPPCDPNFDYCIYRIGTEYAGTNFESAGVRVKERTDLTTQDACLTTLPDGYSNINPKTRQGAGYATSVFSPLGDAGAGHYASGALYRLYYGTTCYEFETRIGETQFANYPAGSIQLFTDADRAAVYAELIGIVNSANIAATKTPIVFPAVDETASTTNS